MASIMNIGTSALLAYQRALSVTSHNIANANTAGYNRQVAQFGTRIPQPTGYGWIGSGVQTESIERMYSGYIDNQVRGYTSSSNEFEIYHAFAARLDNVLADPDAGISTALQGFTNALQDVADDPSSSAARQVLLSEGESLTNRFQSLDGFLNDLNEQVNSQLTNSVNEVNRLTGSIANLNERIVVAQAASGQPPNDLLDQRDTLIKSLSEYVSVSTLMQDDGAINVMVGNGQTLVVGSIASVLTTTSLPGVDPKVGIGLLTNTGSAVDITQQMKGGKIAGLIGFRDGMLDSAMNNLGRMALGIGDFFNQQHHQGMDLNGALGVDFFSLGDVQWEPLAGATGSLSIDYADVSNLTDADYTLSFNGSWSINRSNTGQSVSMTGTGTAVDPFIVDGMQIVVPAAPVAGDSYFIQPTRQAAGDIQQAITSISQIAAAFPVLGSASFNNTGTGSMSPGSVTDINNPSFQTTAGQLSPPLLVRFTDPNTYEIYDNSNPATPVLLEGGIAYDPATGGNVFPTPGGIDPGYSMHLAGVPAGGDEFTFDYNTGGVGDNRNALALGALFEQNLLAGGTERFSATYGSLIAEVATDTHQTELNSMTHNMLLDQAMGSQSALSGVNLDEEAANLLRFQQAYQAAAQVVAAANEMFDTLLAATRR